MKRDIEIACCIPSTIRQAMTISHKKITRELAINLIYHNLWDILFHKTRTSACYWDQETRDQFFDYNKKLFNVLHKREVIIFPKTKEISPRDQFLAILKQLMIYNNLWQKDLAQIFGVSTITISHWFCKKNFPVQKIILHSDIRLILKQDNRIYFKLLAANSKYWEVYESERRLNKIRDKLYESVN